MIPHRFLSLFAPSALAAALLLAVSAPLSHAAPAIGAAAPDFQLADVSGQTHSLADYKGKYVVLEWTNPECPFVQKHYGSGNMQKLQEAYHEKRRRVADHRFVRAEQGRIPHARPGPGVAQKGRMPNPALC